MIMYYVNCVMFTCATITSYCIFVMRRNLYIDFRMKDYLLNPAKEFIVIFRPESIVILHKAKKQLGTSRISTFRTVYCFSVILFLCHAIFLVRPS